MLEGKELEGKIGDSGGYSVDVDDKGGIKIDVNYAQDFGSGKFNSSVGLETNVFNIAEAIAAKTKTPYDDQVIAKIKALLGIK